MTAAPGNATDLDSARSSGWIWVVALILVAAGVMVWNTLDQARDARIQQERLLRSSVNNLAAEAALRIADLRRALRLFADGHRDLLRAAAQDPSGEAFERLRERVMADLPQVFGVTVADHSGAPLVNDFEGRVETVCREDIAAFARRPKGVDVYIHPHPEGHHFDLMVPLDLGPAGPGVFFVSFRPEVLAALLREQRLPDHELVLVSTVRPGLIEITAAGGRDALRRAPVLSRAERARVAYRSAVPGTRWELAALREPGAGAAGAGSWTEGVLALVVVVGVGVVALWRMRVYEGRLRGQQRRSVAQETRLRAVLDATPDGVFATDADGVIETANPAAGRIFGYPYGALAGRALSELIPALGHDACRGWLRRHPGGRGEVDGRRGDGAAFPVELSVSEMRPAGRLMYTGIVRDITARKRREQDLRETNALREAILNSANFSVIATDPEGVILAINRTALRWLGYREEEVVGRLSPEVIHDPAEVAARAEALSRELGRPVAAGFEAFVAKARAGGADENTWTYIRKDGTRFPVLLSVTALRDADGGIAGFLGVASDITERQKIDRMKNEFIAVASHELRTPLTAIQGSLGLLAGGAVGELPARARELVDMALSNSGRLVRLLDDMLDVEKIESGGVALRREPVDVTALLEASVATHRPFAAAQGVTLEITGRAPGLVVPGDPDRLEQVLVNLISNAVKFSPAGSTVALAVAREDGGARISVRDQGPGIPESFRPRLFQKFAQADVSDARRRGGTGLGLSICKAIVERLGGAIEVDSRPGEGSTFHVRLPAPPAESGA